jgi:hypothetical protein
VAPGFPHDGIVRNPTFEYGGSPVPGRGGVGSIIKIDKKNIRFKAAFALNEKPSCEGSCPDTPEGKRVICTKRTVLPEEEADFLWEVLEENPAGKARVKEGTPNNKSAVVIQVTHFPTTYKLKLTVTVNCFCSGNTPVNPKSVNTIAQFTEQCSPPTNGWMCP